MRKAKRLLTASEGAELRAMACKLKARMAQIGSDDELNGNVRRNLDKHFCVLENMIMEIERRTDNENI